MVNPPTIVTKHRYLENWLSFVCNDGTSHNWKRNNLTYA